MATALRPHLILEEEARRSGLLVESDRADDIQGVAVAGVGIHQDRPVRQPADPPGRVRHLGLGQIAEIRFSDQRGGDAEATDEKHFKSGAMRQAGGQCIVDATEHQRTIFGQKLPDRLCFGHTCHRFTNRSGCLSATAVLDRETFP